jgi:hypothetical protein
MSTTAALGDSHTTPCRSSDRFRRSIRAELTKFRSLRANRAALLTALVAVVGIGIAVSAATANGWDTSSAADHASFDPVAVGLTGGALGQLIVGVLGVLVITGEFASGTIGFTYAAVPDRRIVLASKAVVVTAVTFVVSLVGSVAAFLASQHILAEKHLDTSFSSPGVARAVVGGALYLTIAALLGLGIGSIIRHSAAAIAALVCVLLVLPSIVGLLPGSLAHDIGRYLPTNAGAAVIKVNPDSWDMAPWSGLALFAAYALAALVAGGLMLRRRDV